MDSIIELLSVFQYYAGSMDFVSDRTRFGSNIRDLAVIDEVTRKCMALELDSSLTGRRVSAVLNRIELLAAAERNLDRKRLCVYQQCNECLSTRIRKSTSWKIGVWNITGSGCIPPFTT